MIGGAGDLTQQEISNLMLWRRLMAIQWQKFPALSMKDLIRLHWLRWMVETGKISEWTIKIKERGS